MSTKRLFMTGILFLFTAGLSCSAWAVSKTIALPLTLDYPLIRSALIAKVYSLPGQKALLLDPKNRCVRLELSDPQVRPDGQSILLLNKIKLQAGLEIGKGCLKPLDWEGYVEVRLKPYLEQKTWLLHFKAQDSKFYNLQHERMRVAEIIWKLIKKHMHPPLNRVAIDLAPPINDVTRLLPFFVEPGQQEKFKSALNTLRPGAIRLGADAVTAEVLLDLDIPEEMVTEKAPEKPLTMEEKARFIRSWETWDSFLVRELLSLAGRPLTEEEKEALLKTLLEMRYGFVDALDQRLPDRDLVREQFIKSWTELGPILRKHLSRGESHSLLRYTGYFTAMDSLKILDQVGRTFGLEISRDGLIRLARLMSDEQTPWTPRYDWGVDPALRTLLGFGAPLDETGPGYEEEELDLPDLSSGKLFFAGMPRGPVRLISSSGGGVEAPKAAGELKKWLPDEKNLDDYLRRVEEVLRGATERVLSEKKWEEKYLGLFRLLLYATAWQESCWRQLTASGGKIRCLLSYNGSSVGLMQVNVRVWRGLYQPRSLRWNIHYNVLAGTEILELYFRRYALEGSNPERSFSPEVLSASVYAMYNGGPRELGRFLKRHRRGKLNTYDRLFLEKYDWVKNGRFDRLQMCLGGKES
jgi:hypothetical protein